MLSNELLCVNTELRVIYDAYCVRQQGMPWGWGRPQHSAALTSAQLWQVMRDGNVFEPDCSLVDINVALAQVWHSVASLSQLTDILYGMCVRLIFIPTPTYLSSVHPCLVPCCRWLLHVLPCHSCHSDQDCHQGYTMLSYCYSSCCAPSSACRVTQVNTLVMCCRCPDWLTALRGQTTVQA